MAAMGSNQAGKGSEKMKYLVTWKSIAFPDMDLQTCVEAETLMQRRLRQKQKCRKILRMSIMLTM